MANKLVISVNRFNKTESITIININKMTNLAEILVPISICVVLPIVVVSLTLRQKMNRDAVRKDIILAALEKNADVDVEELVKKMNTPDKLLKEKLLKKLQWGCIFTIIGIGLLLISLTTFSYLYEPGKEDVWMFTAISTFISLGLGVSFIINYFVGKKLLTKEMEAEEQNMRKA